jgi:hypothetical protein
MKISFEVDEEKYRVAICQGWELRLDEQLAPDELQLVPTSFDLCCALSVIGDREITNVEYER